MAFLKVRYHFSELPTTNDGLIVSAGLCNNRLCCESFVFWIQCDNYKMWQYGLMYRLLLVYRMIFVICHIILIFSHSFF